MKKVQKFLCALFIGVTLVTALGVLNTQSAQAVVHWSRSNLSWNGNQYRAVADAEFIFRGEVRAHAVSDQGRITRSSSWVFGTQGSGIVRAATTWQTGPTNSFVNHAHEVR